MTLRCIPIFGYYDNNTQIAQKCPVGCFSCSSSDQCGACNVGYFLTPDNRCVSKCPPRYYGNSITFVCQLCPYDCLYCNPNGTCISCDEQNDYRSLDLPTSRCIAKPRYFENSTQVCSECPTNCSTCRSLVFCTSCTNNTYLDISNLCSTSCSPRLYPNPNTFICQPCPYDCLTCDGQGNCISCDPNDDKRSLDKTTSRCVPIQGYF